MVKEIVILNQWDEECGVYRVHEANKEKIYKVKIELSQGAEMFLGYDSGQIENVRCICRASSDGVRQTTAYFYCRPDKKFEWYVTEWKG